MITKECKHLYFNTTFVHVELEVTNQEEALKRNFNTTFVHVEPIGLSFKNISSSYFNTTFVHVELALKFSIFDFFVFQYNICTCGAKRQRSYSLTQNPFQYNICTCGAQKKNKENQHYSYFNTTFVHVEPKYPFKDQVVITTFQYNICTCGANITLSDRKNAVIFQYNICTCGA